MAIQKLRVEINVNGRDYVRDVEPRYLLADFLRHELGLKGTHIGCEHGVCGACTVMIDGRTARSCLHFAVDVTGTKIKTVEGLGSESALDPVQQAFHDHHALQCGFCTPGFLMTTHELLDRNPNPTESEIRTALTNNICRCTGYTNIIAAVATAAQLMRRSETSGESAQ
jgi:aerobic-type carbon monoxide dehydrogenase small subunit (CoxS/CutS family)